MPRKTKAEQAGHYAKGRKHGDRWPAPSIWGSGPGAEKALERWASRHDCDGTCEGFQSCAHLARLTRMHRMYGRRQ